MAASTVFVAPKPSWKLSLMVPSMSKMTAIFRPTGAVRACADMVHAASAIAGICIDWVRCVLAAADASGARARCQHRQATERQLAVQPGPGCHLFRT